jgi:hypothetical protein
MTRYLVERSIPGAGKLTRAELKAIIEQSLRVQQELEAEIQWIHSMITTDRMVSLFIADDEAIVREHALRSGLPISRISEVTAVIGPSSDLIS